MKNGIDYEKKVYLKIKIFVFTIYIDQASALPFKPMLQLYRNHSTDLQSKLNGWFLYNGNTRLK